MCGQAIYQYEHFDPPFEQARAHLAAGITLLCGAHHDKVTRGHLSRETVAAANRDPFAKRAGYSFDVFDVGDRQPTIIMGTVGFEGERALVIGDVGADETILGAKPPEEPGGPFRLTAILSNKTGDETLRVVENEWRAPSTLWDVEVKGRRLTIRNAGRDVALVIRTDPPDLLTIESLEMLYRGALIRCDEHNGLYVAPKGCTPLNLSQLSLVPPSGTIGIRIPAALDVL